MSSRCKYCGNKLERDDGVYFYAIFFGSELLKRANYCCEHHYEEHTGKDWGEAKKSGAKNIFTRVGLIVVAWLLVSLIAKCGNPKDESQPANPTQSHTEPQRQANKRIQALDQNNSSKYVDESNQPRTDNMVIISKFVSAQKQRDYQKIKELFADKLDRYFLEKNISADSAISESQKYDSIHPENHYENVRNITTLGNDIKSITAICSFCRATQDCKDIRLNIQFNNDGKISRIRALNI